MKKNLQFDFILCKLSKRRFAQAKFQKKKKRRPKLWSREMTRVKVKMKKKTKFEGFKLWSKRKKKKEKLHQLAVVKNFEMFV